MKALLGVFRKSGKRDARMFLVFRHSSSLISQQFRFQRAPNLCPLGTPCSVDSRLIERGVVPALVEILPSCPVRARYRIMALDTLVESRFGIPQATAGCKQLRDRTAIGSPHTVCTQVLPSSVRR